MRSKETQEQMMRIARGGIGAWLGFVIGVILTFGLMKLLAQHHVTRDHPDAKAFAVVGAILLVALTSCAGIWLGSRTSER